MTWNTLNLNCTECSALDDSCRFQLHLYTGTKQNVDWPMRNEDFMNCSDALVLILIVYRISTDNYDV